MARKKDMVDWEQVRIDAAINAMNSILTGSFRMLLFQFLFKKEVAEIAVKYADELVEELQKKNLKNEEK